MKVRGRVAIGASSGVRLWASYWSSLGLHFSPMTEEGRVKHMSRIVAWIRWGNLLQEPAHSESSTLIVAPFPLSGHVQHCPRVSELASLPYSVCKCVLKVNQMKQETWIMLCAVYMALESSLPLLKLAIVCLSSYKAPICCVFHGQK